MRVVLGVVLVAAAAGFVFMLLGTDVLQSRERLDPALDRKAPPAVEWADRESLDRMSEQLADLAAAMDRLGRRLEELRPSPDSRMTRATDPTPAETPGGAAVEAGRVGGRSSITGVGAPPDSGRRQRFEELRGQPWGDITRRHWFWTFDQALEHYGPPDSIYPSEGGRVDFIYRVGEEEHRLQFYDGRLLIVN
jgi:hypothetical protein